MYLLLLQKLYENVGCSSGGSRTFRQRRFSSFINGVFAVVLVFVMFSFNISLGEQINNNTPGESSSILTLHQSRLHPRFVPVKSSGTSKDAKSKENPRQLEVEDLDGDLVSSSKTLFFGEDGNGVPIVLGTWFRIGSFTLAFAMFGTGFLMSCAAAAIYYVVFVVTEPSQQVRSLKKDQGWTAGKVLRALQLAYETYQTFDPYSPICQLKTVCEIQESGYFQGSVIKRLSHFIVHTDLIENKLQNAAELRAADKIGNDPEERCEEKFTDCRFSLNKLYENYVKMN